MRRQVQYRNVATPMRPRFFITGSLALLVLLAVPHVSQTQIPPSAVLQQDNPSTIKMTVGLVVLHATTENQKGVPVPGLNKENFQVFEDGIAQRIEFFGHGDIPVTVGLVVDGSGSMGSKRSDVISAARTFVESSNANDEMFVVNFNEHVRFGLPEDVPFTSHAAPLQLAIALSPTAGETALYDAIAAGLEHLKKGNRDKKVLIVISDGGDNASSHTLKQITKLAVESDAVIYTIGLFDESDADGNPGVLKSLARTTGGEVFLPETIGDLVPVCARIARDIRNQYAIAYTPTNSNQDGGYRSILVKANAPGGDHLVVRTRPGYYAPTAQPRSSPRTAPADKQPGKRQ